MAQLGYITLGTNQLARAIAFYDVLLGSLGATRFLTGAHGVSWSFGPGSTSLSVLEPFDGKAATVGSGVMVAIGLASREQVAAAHARALELGAADEGGPGRRATPASSARTSGISTATSSPCSASSGRRTPPSLRRPAASPDRPA
jgi:catechol 2,3-dioxygenase-like lactoylglutathione lyase family enzyme